MELQLRWKSWLPVPCKQPQTHSVRSSEKSEPWRSGHREVAMRWAKLYGSLLAYHHDHDIMSNQQKICIALPLTDFMPCFSDFPVTKETKCCFSFLWCPTVTRHKDNQTWSPEVRAVPRRTGKPRHCRKKCLGFHCFSSNKKVWPPKPVPAESGGLFWFFIGFPEGRDTFVIDCVIVFSFKAVFGSLYLIEV